MLQSFLNPVPLPAPDQAEFLKVFLVPSLSLSSFFLFKTSSSVGFLWRGTLRVLALLPGGWLSTGLFFCIKVKRTLSETMFSDIEKLALAYSNLGSIYSRTIANTG